MTTLTVEPTTESPARGGLQFLSRAVKSRGYGRVGAGVLAAGVLDGRAVRLIAPLERIAVTELKMRTGGGKVSVKASAPADYHDLVTTVAAEAAVACGVDGAELVLDVRAPGAGDLGSDAAEAVALSVIDAVAKACERPLRTADRNAVLARTLPGPVAGLAAGVVALVDADGLVLQTGSERVALLLAAPAQPDPSLPAGGEPVGHVQPRGDLDTASWIAASGAGADHPVVTLLGELMAGLPGALGVVGGHSKNAPVAVVLAPGSLATAQRLTQLALPALPAGWKIGLTKTSLATA